MTTAPRKGDTTLAFILDVDLTAQPFPLAVGIDRHQDLFKIDLRVMAGIDHIPLVGEYYWIERRFGWWTIASLFVPQTDDKWGDWADGSPVSGDSSWTAMALVNSWVNYGGVYSTAAYRKGGDGIVRLKGKVKNGSSSTAVVATLPGGYRPSEQHVFATVANNAIARVDITTAGAITPVVGSTTYLSLDGIMFYAA